MIKRKAFVSWSTGKDSAFALHEARRLGVEVVGLPCLKVAIPSPCSNEIYEREMAIALGQIGAQGVTAIVFGDLFLADLRAYREANLAAVGFEGIFPLWHRDTTQLARDMLVAGVCATLTCVDPRAVAPSFAGRAFDETLLAELPAAVDPCGENGEFHTFVSAGPMLHHPIEVRAGAVVERDGFVFADLWSP